MAHNEFQPGAIAPDSGLYEELNVFGTPTGRAVTVTQGETFPALPRGFSWRPLSSLSASELRARAQHYRQMAGTATTSMVMTELLKLATRFDALADQRDKSA